MPRAPLEDQPPLLPLSPVSTRRLVAAVSSGYETSANAGEERWLCCCGLGEHVHILGSMEWSIRTNALRPTLGIGVSTGRDRGGGRQTRISLEGFRARRRSRSDMRRSTPIRKGSLLEASAVYGQDLDGAERMWSKASLRPSPLILCASRDCRESALQPPSISRAGDGMGRESVHLAPYGLEVLRSWSSADLPSAGKVPARHWALLCQQRCSRRSNVVSPTILLLSAGSYEMTSARVLSRSKSYAPMCMTLARAMTGTMLATTSEARAGAMPT